MAQGKQKSPWVWISLLVIIGLFVSFILFLDQKIVKGTRSPDTAEAGSARNAEPVFDFYTVLPERGVDIPTGSSLPGADQQRPADLPDTVRYVLQAGSFARPEDAERRKAELAFLGLESSVRKADVAGRIYHRVELGPFDDDGRLSSIKNRLIENDINYIAKSMR